jgi:trans-aconitate methyltransferase
MSDFKLKASVQSGFAPAAAYDTHRPTYPSEAVDQLLQRLEIAGVTGAKVIDLAAGTGKFTEILASRPERFTIVAIEPHDDMRRELERKNLAGTKVINGHAEDLSVIPDQSVAAVIAAQASNRDCPSSLQISPLTLDVGISLVCSIMNLQIERTDI